MGDAQDISRNSIRNANSRRPSEGRSQLAKSAWMKFAKALIRLVYSSSSGRTDRLGGQNDRGGARDIPDRKCLLGNLFPTIPRT